MSELNRDAKRVFLEALDHGPERGAFLDAACGRDAVLRRRVDGLLHAHEISHALMAAPTNGGSSPPPDHGALREARGRRIGRYEIVRLLGEGGFGTVYLVRQREPVEREAALKIVKPGMDTREIIGRFEAERQALAVMSHPNIAKVFDAGATDQGRPYFVMEYVPGEPITRYCDRHRIGTRARLDLFLQVCDGVAHAHQKGIIHRDLKPSNLLVSVRAGRGGQAVPSIIDFGVAKATQQRLPGRSVYTKAGTLVGTPGYMSPEQADPTTPDIDTRTDVYALGVVLHELLVGALPASTEGPVKPSTRFGTSGADASDTAERRGTDPKTLQRQLSGDLDWIVLRAIERDRPRRYGTVAELAADIRRHLADEPVTAGPPSRVYRARKFIRRHQAGVATGMLVILALVVGVAGTALGLFRSARSEATARREAAAAEQVTSFMVSLFSLADPHVVRGDTVTAIEILDRGVDEVESLKDQPLIQARLQRTMGNVYDNLGLYERAEPLLEAALETYRAELGAADLLTIGTLGEVGVIHWRQGRLDEARPYLERSVETHRRRLGAAHPLTLDAVNNLASLFLSLGRLDDAETLYTQTLATRTRTQGDEHPGTLGAANNLAALFERRNRLGEAKGLHERTLEIRRRVQGNRHPDTLGAASNLAGVYAGLGRFDEARVLHEETLAIRREVLGDRHPDTLTSVSNLASLDLRQRDYDAAERGHEEALIGRRETLGPGHPRTLASTFNLASLYRVRDRLDDARTLLLSALEGAQETLGANHPQTLRTSDELALTCAMLNRLGEAETLYLRSVQARIDAGDGDHDQVWSALYNLACIATRGGRHDDALAYLRRAVAHGFSDGFIHEDADLDPLRDDPRFRAIVEGISR